MLLSRVPQSLGPSKVNIDLARMVRGRGKWNSSDWRVGYLWTVLFLLNKESKIDYVYNSSFLIKFIFVRVFGYRNVI